METFNTILTNFAIVFSIQFLTSAVINTIANVRIPKSRKDFIKLTFLPYAMWYWVFKHKKK